MTWLVRHARVLLVAYVVVLAVVLFSPTDGVQTQAVTSVVDVLHSLGIADRSVWWPRVEFAENVAIIAPVAFFGSLVRPGYGWRDWTAIGFVAASAVEILQGVLLPGRSATYSDVVANTLGALVGAVAVSLVRRATTPADRATSRSAS